MMDFDGWMHWGPLQAVYGVLLSPWEHRIGCQGDSQQTMGQYDWLPESLSSV